MTAVANRRFWVLAGLLAAGAAGCQSKVVNYTLTIVRGGCGLAPLQDFQGVAFIRIRIVGEGMEPVVVTTPAATRIATLPDIPAGPDRVIEVRGYDGDPDAGGKVVLVGSTLPFSVPTSLSATLIAEALQKTVFLRQVNGWSRPGAAEGPSMCGSTSARRAGHTATLLEDGKVFIAGGFDVARGTQNRVALVTAEVFDPATGSFTKVKDMSVPSGGQVVKVSKAFHTANRLKNGQVLLWGGENYQVISGVNIVSPVQEILAYDAEQDAYGSLQRQMPPMIRRTQHRAAVDANGRLLVVGGLKFNNTGSGPRLLPVTEVEWLDPDQPRPQVLEGMAVPRVDAAVASVRQGEQIAVAGGTDGAVLKDDVLFFKWEGTSFRQQPQTAPPRLTSGGRRGSAAVPFRDGNDMLVAGGYSDVATVRPVGITEIVQPGVSTVTRVPDVGNRGDACAVTLRSGSVLVVGGRTAEPSGSMVRSDDSVVELVPDGAATTRIDRVPLPTARYWHTCTLLADGSVLVTGGLKEAPPDPNASVLDDAWIYTPAPAD